MGENLPPRPSAAVPDDGKDERGGTVPHLHSVGPDAYPNWDAIYLDNVERLYRMMYARVGNRADAEDLTAEVFQAALKPLRASASVGEVRAYLLATARAVLARLVSNQGDFVTTNHSQRVKKAESKRCVADPAILRATGVVALLGIGVIHFVQIVPTVQETPLLGVGYVALIAGSVVVAAWLVVANDMRAWAAAGVLSVAVLVGYAFTRFFGTTFDNQDVGNWSCMLGLASIFVEVCLLALSGSALALTEVKVSEPSGDIRNRLPRITEFERRATSASRP